MAKKEERFEVTFRDGSQLKDEGVRQILVDKETGVNYLCSEAFQYLRLTVQSDQHFEPRETWHHSEIGRAHV